MAINHADHDHPATPAARAACRKAMGAGPSPKSTKGGIPVGFVRSDKPVRLHGVAKANGTGFRAFAINNEGDLANEVPHVFSEAIRHAWTQGWAVRSANPYNDTEKRVTITSEHGELALVYKSANPNGVWGVFWRPVTSSITRRITTGPIISNGIVKLERGDRVEDPE